MKKIPAIACDIDGVLVRGYRKSIPTSIPALNLIRKGLNEILPNIFPEKTTIQLPFVCLTNSGGCLEIDKANYINEILQLKNEFLSKHIILNFTPFRKLLENINNDPILIMGSGNVESIVKDCKVKNYLFWDEYRFLDQNSELNKNLKITRKLEKRFSNNLYNPIFHSSLLDVKSIFILHDPYEWENQIATILSILKKNNSNTINIYSSANDALYSDCFPLSRFGIGSFNTSLKHIYYEQFKKELNVIYSGKPTSMTFDYAKSRLNNLSDFPISNYYMIGDNPKVDIIGGKKAGFKTILVKTGVYKHGDETEDPDYLVEDFNEAIQIIIKQENLTLK